MPFYDQYKCNNCSFCKVAGEPESLYITTEDGERVNCLHPGENSFIANMLHLGEEETWEARYHTPSWYWGPSRRRRHKEIKNLISSRVGSITHCICEKLHEFDIDYKKDSRECPVCSSRKTIRVLDLDGRSCPKCQVGRIEKKFTGVIT